MNNTQFMNRSVPGVQPVKEPLALTAEERSLLRDEIAHKKFCMQGELGDLLIQADLYRRTFESLAGMFDGNGNPLNIEGLPSQQELKEFFPKLQKARFKFAHLAAQEAAYAEGA